VPQHAEALQAREVHVTLHRTLVLVEPHAVHPVLDVPQDDAPLRAGVHVQGKVVEFQLRAHVQVGARADDLVVLGDHLLFVAVGVHQDACPGHVPVHEVPFERFPRFSVAVKHELAVALRQAFPVEGAFQQRLLVERELALAVRPP